VVGVEEVEAMDQAGPSVAVEGGEAAGQAEPSAAPESAPVGPPSGWPDLAALALVWAEEELPHWGERLLNLGTSPTPARSQSSP
jgi:hypothetical protein